MTRPYNVELTIRVEGISASSVMNASEFVCNAIRKLDLPIHIDSLKVEER